MKAFGNRLRGFIASTLTDKLLEEGIHIIGIDCFTEYYPIEIKKRIFNSP